VRIEPSHMTVVSKQGAFDPSIQWRGTHERGRDVHLRGRRGEGTAEGWMNLDEMGCQGLVEEDIEPKEFRTIGSIVHR
jgi:hypothetical protein